MLSPVLGSFSHIATGTDVLCDGTQLAPLLDNFFNEKFFASERDYKEVFNIDKRV